MAMPSQTQNSKYLEFRNWRATTNLSLEYSTSLTDETRRVIFEIVISAIGTYYLDQAVAKELASRLCARVSEGVYNHISSGTDLAATITTDLQALSGDKHFRCVFGISPEEPSRDEQVRRLEKVNYGFGNVKILDGDIALVEITLFPPVNWEGVRERIRDAMHSVSVAAALIIDLRSCRGGDPKTVALVASYFIETATSSGNVWLRMVNPSDGVVENLHGEQFPKDRVCSAAKPIYCLTSHATISGGEDLAYGLQARKRATVIGERTVGAANLPRACVLPRGFVLWVPHKYPVSPITGRNWERVGVVPDVECKEEKAVEKACEVIGKKDEWKGGMDVTGE